MVKWYLRVICRILKLERERLEISWKSRCGCFKLARKIAIISSRTSTGTRGTCRCYVISPCAYEFY